jgi:hypothetical protein
MPRDIAPAHEKAPAEYNPAGARPREVPCANLKETETYFSEVLMSVNLVLRFVPRPLTTAIMASEMPAAIKPYSMAVAPDSSEKKLNKVRFNTASLGFQGGNPSTTLRYLSESKAGLIRELQFYIEVGSTFSPISCVGTYAVGWRNRGRTARGSVEPKQVPGRPAGLPDSCTRQIASIWLNNQADAGRFFKGGGQRPIFRAVGVPQIVAIRFR